MGKKERCRGKTVEWRNRAKLSTFLVIRRFYSLEKKKKRKRGSKATLTTRRITGFLSSARENFSNFSRFSRTTCFYRLYSTDHLTIRVSIVSIFFSFKREPARPSIKKRIKKHHFLSSPVFKNILPTGEDSGTRPNVKFRLRSSTDSLSCSMTIFEWR